MSTQITDSFVQQFKSNLLVLFQQEGSKLRPWVMNQPVVGESDYIERLAATEAVLRTTRHGDTPLVDSDHSRRKLNLADYEWADLIDQADRVRLLIEPQNAYAINAANALGRTTDDVIITAATGDALEGPAGATVTAFPAGQTIAAGAAGLTLGKIIESARMFNLANVPMENRVFVASPHGLEDMLNDTTITSADYNTVKMLMRGEVDTFMGYRWVISTRLALATADRSCLAFHQRSLTLGLGMDVTVKISERNDKSHSTQVYAAMSLGAARNEDSGVIEVVIVE